MIEELPLMQINEILHYMDFDDTDFKIGDLVLDLEDYAYGYIDMFMMASKEYIALKHGFVVQIGVPLNRIVKLKPHHDNCSNRTQTPQTK